MAYYALVLLANLPLCSLDIDALFAKGSKSPTQVKEENAEGANGNGRRTAADADDISVKRQATSGSNRVIGNQNPIGDFTRVVSESSGNELLEKAVGLMSGRFVPEKLKWRNRWQIWVRW